MMKELPILMSGPMILATLDERKTQTRRVATPHTSTINGATCQRWMWDELDFSTAWVDNSPVSPAGNPGPYLKVPMPCDGTVQRVYPRWFPGDRLWVKEGWSVPGMFDGLKPSEIDPMAAGTVRYEADGHRAGRYRSSRFMLKWASRITLEVVSVRVERLQEITAEDIIAEGVCVVGRVDGFLAKFEPTGDFKETQRATFAHLWDSLNANRGFSWKSNPWTWCISFKVVS